MTEFFQTLEQEFDKYIKEIQRKIYNINNQSNEMKEAAIQQAQLELRDAEQCIKQMEVEANPLPEKMRREVNQKIRKYRTEYDDTRKKFMNCEESYLDQKNKEKLMGERFENDDFNRNGNQNSLIYLQNERLKDAKKTGFATLDIASDTNTRLHGQTEILIRQKDRLRNMEGDLGESHGLINDMQRRIQRNKLTFYSVMGVVGLAVVLILFSYF